MFSKKTLLVVGVILVIALNIIGLSLSSRKPVPDYGLGRFGLVIVAPIQATVTYGLDFIGDIWRHYFALVAAARENDRLQKALEQATARLNACSEIERANRRLRSLIRFQQAIELKVLPAEVVGKDPSPWFKSVIIDKGRADGVVEGMPVVIPEGIAGQVVAAARHHAKVLLIIDANNAVDALVQRSRARGIVTGASDNRCVFKYVLRQDDVQAGDILISSGLDGVYPKGLPVGRVAAVDRPSAAIFQEVAVTPVVDFQTLEEVLVVIDPRRPEPEVFQ
ncbi:MAG TPA: rod shape-determining protein MreC [Desulfobacteraceae bacterium]|nr:rod shape-determining protein MreC [Deltaproteobacteria bacterium]HDI60577.1 rod shape-determining protein MreC [Desulfobacteraceae bacterium]